VNAEAIGQLYVRLERISRRLRHLVGLRAALAPFRATLHVLREELQEPEARRRLLALWRPCQEQLDLLLDDARHSQDWAVRLRLLRQEMEGNLLDEMYSPAALGDLADTFDQACELSLIETERDLRGAVAGLGGRGDVGGRLR